MGNSKDTSKDNKDNKDNKDKSGSGIGDLLNNVADAAKDVGKAVTDVAKDAGKAVTNAAETVVKGVSNTAQNVGQAAGNAAQTVSVAAQSAAQTVVKGVSNTAQNVGQAAGNAAQTVVKGAGSAAQAVGSAAQGAAQAVGGAVQGAAQAVGNVAQEAVDFLDEKFEKNTARIWLDEEIRKKGWPEARFASLKVKKDVGIAFSGGGIRSATAALGQTRALHALGLIRKVRYVACISGGSWFAVPWVYLPGQTTDDDFLGEYSPPEKLCWKDLQVKYKDAKPGSYMKIVEGAELVNKSVLMQVFSQGQELGNSSKDETWGDLIGKNYLKPLSLYHKGAQRYATYNDDVRKTILSRNDGLSKNDFDCVEHDRPYLLVNGVAINWNLMGKFETLVAEKKDSSVKPKDYPFYPFEFTPIYSGINTLYEGKETEGVFKFGGGYIENIGFDTRDPLGKIDSNFVKVKTKEQFNRLSVQDIMAVSGAAPAFHVLVAQTITDGATGAAVGAKVAGFPGLLIGGALSLVVSGGNRIPAGIGGSGPVKRLTGIFPRFFYWHLDKDKNVGSTNLYFGDGGFLDNYGLMPLLRRRVKNIILFINTDTPFIPPAKSITQENIAALTSAIDRNPINNLQIDGALPALFGLHQSAASSSGVPHQWSGHKMHVFRKAAFEGVIAQLSKAKNDKSGGPIYAVASLEVIPNEFLGIDGGYYANVCFVLLQSCRKWESALTGEYAERLDSSGERKPQDASLAAFPNFATFGVHDTLEVGLSAGEKISKYVDLQELNREQAYLLSNLTDWITREVCADKAVQAMFA